MAFAVMLGVIRNTPHGFFHKQFTPVTMPQIIGFPTFRILRQSVVVQGLIGIEISKAVFPIPIAFWK